MRIRDSRRFTELLSLQSLSQRKLADIAHVSQAFISLLAHGRRGARPETAWRIATALGVLTEELFSATTPDSATTPTPAPAPAPAPAPVPGSTAAPTTPTPTPTATHFARHQLSKNRRPTRTHRPRTHRPTPCTTHQAAA
ncbi:helix-turn-helix domain-containing protein [Streptomyces sp. FIT100]|uniref:helix-turn-helix domain-containing protein n=1 Tax=Streptomyces sp. FIT100 TaxID=2837956 RepID=UPI0021C7E5F8|nr:helix-turn-helix transcriptional regulator [Streptomyces sp. FIT100]UUN30899.1 helix-turn-helix domain-containing protein [Streptomyces sp. FIT100]UUN30901.1 helix-turn-helix domain-containing protein [Streptomyces sp. FIT100]